ncbi:MAG: nitroreductase family protein, partial [Candidatus Cloacimonetes bacterium]|nr:nitroreductase family protein [Candidatus Cloacimonadota bacterium]
MLKDLIRSNRSYRRFDARHLIDQDTLTDLIALARLSASAGNLQNLRFYLSCTPQTNDVIFPHLRWAAYLRYWKGPAEEERPTAYILLLGPEQVSKFHHYDAGIAAQSITLGAAEKSLGACLIASFDREELHSKLHLPEELDILLVVALGKPAEKVMIDEVSDPDDMEYWRDEDDVHHVPKRSLD